VVSPPAPSQRSLADRMRASERFGVESPGSVKLIRPFFCEETC
jgi:hypothetical protein